MNDLTAHPSTGSGRTVKSRYMSRLKLVATMNDLTAHPSTGSGRTVKSRYMSRLKLVALTLVAYLSRNSFQGKQHEY